MIIPSIDLQSGSTVQLVGGKELAIDAGDPIPLASKFGRLGDIAVIDLDAAIGTGDNRKLIEAILPIARCRVGGGIRDVETAVRWLDAGAAKIIIGTAASVELVSQLPRERVIVALDAVHDEKGQGEIVDHGWRKGTGKSVLDEMAQLRDYVGGFLITFVEREGRMTGIDLDTISKYADAAGDAKLTAAGGITTANEIAQLDAMGVDSQVGMAIYTGKLPLAASFCGPMNSDRTDGLWPTIVTNESGVAMGLAYSNLESVSATIESGQVHYWSRKRGLWKKGATSGATQEILSIDMDCDRDALRFKVRQSGDGFCHLPQSSCFGNFVGLEKLKGTLRERLNSAPEGSYTRKLFDSDELLNAKIREEGNELAQAATRDEITQEAADVIYFALAKLAKYSIDLSDVETVLDRRALKVTRRRGLAKKEFSS